MFIRSFSMPDPTWLELGHFVAFLNTQLKACEKSVYTDPLYVDDADMNVIGFKSFVAMFMIKMSVVCKNIQCQTFFQYCLSVGR